MDSGGGSGYGYGCGCGQWWLVVMGLWLVEETRLRIKNNNILMKW